MTLHPDLCIDTRAALPLYVGGDLDGDESLTVEAHLADCPACQAARNQAQEARSVLVRDAEVGTGPDLWTSLRPQLVAEGLLGPAATPAPALPSLVRGPRLLPVGLTSAAAAVLFAFLLAGLLRLGEGVGALGQQFEAPGLGGSVAGTIPVVHEAPGVAAEGGLSRLPEGKEPLYLRAREMRAEQGVVAPFTTHGLTPASVLKRR